MISFDGKAFVFSLAIMLGLTIGGAMVGELEQVPSPVLTATHVVIYLLLTINNKLKNAT